METCAIEGFNQGNEFHGFESFQSAQTYLSSGQKVCKSKITQKSFSPPLTCETF